MKLSTPTFWWSILNHSSEVGVGISPSAAEGQIVQTPNTKESGFVETLRVLRVWSCGCLEYVFYSSVKFAIGAVIVSWCRAVASSKKGVGEGEGEGTIHVG